MNPTVPPKIALAGIAKSFGDNRALRGVDLSVAAGTSTVLIGPSGSGKTVLMKSILGLIRPDAGSVRIDGVETVALKGDARMALIGRFGMLFQRGGLFDSLPVWENIAFRLLQDKSMDRKQARDIALGKLVSVGLEASVGDLLPVELSGGMQKRVGLARAIATDPEILLLDEPTAGLDPIMSNVINDLIVKLVEELGATALSITSDMAGARRISDNIVMLHEGRAIWHGPTATVDDSGNPHVDQFIHSRAEGPIEMILGPVA